MSSGGGKGKGGHHEEEHEEHVNHEAWVIPYADVLTLLMALFLVLFALGQIDEENLEIAAESFREEFQGPGFLDFGGTGGSGEGPSAFAAGAIGILDGLGPLPSSGDDVTSDEEGESITDDDPSQVSPPPMVILDDPTQIDDPETMPPGTFEPVEEVEDELSDPGDPLDDVERAVRESAEGTGLADKVGFRREDRGLIVTIVTDQVLFEPGEASIQERGYAILGVVADALADVTNDVMIEGHTDRRPISTTRFPSNWELSTSRATSVLRHLVEIEGFPMHRISAAGYADTRPVDIGDTEEALAKNRRVEIVVLATASGD